MTLRKYAPRAHSYSIARGLSNFNTLSRFSITNCLGFIAMESALWTAHTPFDSHLDSHLDSSFDSTATALKRRFAV